MQLPLANTAGISRLYLVVVIKRWEVPSHNTDCWRSQSSQLHTENYSIGRDPLQGAGSSDHTPGDTLSWSL